VKIEFLEQNVKIGMEFCSNGRAVFEKNSNFVAKSEKLTICF
jgi:hypothetical protein